MKQKDLEILIGALFVAFLFVFYYAPTKFVEIGPVFVSISTFLFAILVGFFISRQSQRYQNLRKFISDFDGYMSTIYRNMQHFNSDVQKKAGAIIKKHYQNILKAHQWDYYFTHKSSTLTDLHILFDEKLKGAEHSTVQVFAIDSSFTALLNAQVIRKNLVSLRLERVPKFQMILIYFLTVIVLLSISGIETQLDLFGSILKAAFVTSVIAAIILLRQLDKLALFEGTIGESSARDVVEIIEGKK